MKFPVVFLDRDGVLTEEKSYILNLNDLIIFPYVKSSIRKIHEYGYKAIVITNQSAIGRGMLDIDRLKKMNDYLIQETRVDAVYYCPHWYQENLPKKNKFQVKCNCRKPQTGLINQALQEQDITLSGSFFIGDRASDIELGKRMNLTTILLESGYGTKRLEYDIQADFICKDLTEAILKLEPKKPFEFKK